MKLKSGSVFPKMPIKVLEGDKIDLGTPREGYD